MALAFPLECVFAQQHEISPHASRIAADIMPGWVKPSQVNLRDYFGCFDHPMM
jgi:hypothetical protein